MNKGRSITELAAELERQVEAKKDYLADTRALEVRYVPEGQAEPGAPTGYQNHV